MKPVLKSEAAPVTRQLSAEEQLNNVELVSLGFVRLPGTDTYASYQITTLGGKVVNMKPVFHQDKQSAEDEVKIDFVKIFVWESE